ncbi:glycoside hydrolase family 99-like domain-containing protein [Vibrio barjaei]|uniref:glycosyltransferase WbsX family protein n=1 Tax=Vibrio barjaei TaxID=1676683 RepID=UPI0022844E51|nr:glycoside hydrolase family 99-like domain-containing protein [Vibrio barjaei]MCY9872550.1 glycoside hydrolase family 99-like domain-containing protein [Vibrio barjaei]
MIDVFAFYFPQLYVTEENSLWWGEGFTDWQLTKEAKPLFEGHHQPRVPRLGYQDQSSPQVLNNQVQLASRYGLAGFNFYHYWFDSKAYLDVPILNLLSDKSLDTKFMLTWANESWTRQWVGKPNEYLIEQKYYSNQSEVDKHYRYLSKCFLDHRYYRIDGRPVLAIYRPELIPDLRSVLARFNSLAQDDGFKSIYFMACRSYDLPNSRELYHDFQGIINFNPRYVVNSFLKDSKVTGLEKYFRLLPEKWQSKLVTIRNVNKKHVIYSYRDVVKAFNHVPAFEGDIPVYQSVFPDWDNTARYSSRATLFSDVTEARFKEMIKLAISNSTESHEKVLFVNAWNEWSESAYLEPDTTKGYKYLEILSEAVKCSSH